MAKQRKVRVVHARGVFADSQTLHLQGGDAASRDGDILTFDHCVLAVGSRPTMFPAFRLDTDLVMDSTGALQLADIPESLLVIGGGYIGLEMGSVYAALGSQVTVVELTEGLLPGVDRDLVKPLFTVQGRVRASPDLQSCRLHPLGTAPYWFKNQVPTGEFARLAAFLGRRQ